MAPSRSTFFANPFHVYFTFVCYACPIGLQTECGRSRTTSGMMVRTALRAGFDDGRISVDLTPSSDQVTLDTNLPGTKYDQSGDYTVKFN